MNTATTTGNWSVRNGKRNQNPAQVPGEELTDVGGKEDELIESIQQHTSPRPEKTKRAGRIAGKPSRGGQKKSGNGQPLVRRWL